MDLTKEKLDWKVHDIADEMVDLMDREILIYGEHRSSESYHKFMDLVITRFHECDDLHKLYPENEIVRHNLEILLLATMTLKLGTMSAPLVS